mmetsp:Transcript_16538/g.33098  ORF Transcript_16538/g.33098 Transcript_16538/m.33098 type:complete len:250 (+) Transcript_16538:922-1671(+)
MPSILVHAGAGHSGQELEGGGGPAEIAAVRAIRRERGGGVDGFRGEGRGAGEGSFGFVGREVCGGGVDDGRGNNDKNNSSSDDDGGRKWDIFECRWQWRRQDDSRGRRVIAVIEILYRRRAKQTRYGRVSKAERGIETNRHPLFPLGNIPTGRFHHTIARGDRRRVHRTHSDFGRRGGIPPSSDRERSGRPSSPGDVSRSSDDGDGVRRIDGGGEAGVERDGEIVEDRCGFGWGRVCQAADCGDRCFEW